jgi:gamma-glutamyl hercynylcysteine S-oxide synthase
MPATFSQDAPIGKSASMDASELSSPQDALAALRAARSGTLELVAHLSEDELERQQSPIMSPLVWDLAHIAAYEDLWLAHRFAGLALLRPDLAELYDAFETPRAKRGEIELLNTAQARAYMEDVDERIANAIAREGVGDGVLHEMVVRHELQHAETMRQTLAMVDMLPPGEPPRAPLDGAALEGTALEGTALEGTALEGTALEGTALEGTALEGTALEGAALGSTALTGAMEGADKWLELPAGAFMMGASEAGFAYDNERPRHRRETQAFRIARRPVSKASWLQFSEGGGYERREWWSDEGWAWKEQYDITHHPDVAAGDPRAPVCHVGWFEADAFARAHEARLPTEAEWERAATWEQETLAAVGRVWEWTSTPFHGYPGFRAYPYREYSEVFFGERYRVLRGGSWASSPRVATRTFRNWDLPERRQIFSGVRLARDV